MLGQEVPTLEQESPLILAEIIRKWAPFVPGLPHAAGRCNNSAGTPSGLQIGLATGRHWATPFQFSPLSYPSNEAYADRFGAVGGYDATHTFHPGAAQRSHRPCIVASNTYLCLVFCPAELLTGIMTRRHAILGPCLAKNAESLPFLLQSSWAESTNTKYRRRWSGWSTWCGTYSEATTCPADPFYIALHFNDIAICAGKLGHLQTAHSGIRWGHWKAGFDSHRQNRIGEVSGGLD